MLPDPGDLHNMNHRVPAQRCLAGKSGLASLIIVRALALPVPRVSPTPASWGVFFVAVCLACVCLLAAAGSLGSRWEANTPSRAGAGPEGCASLPGALPVAKGLGTLPWAPTQPYGIPLLRRAAQPSYRVGACMGALAMFGAQAWSLPSLAQAQLLPKHEEGPSDQAGQMLEVGLRWGWVVCVGNGAETRQVPSIAALSLCYDGLILA